MFHFATLFAATLALLPSLGVVAGPPTASLTSDAKYGRQDYPVSIGSLKCYHLGYKYHLLGQIPSFPKLGGLSSVTGPDSPECGKCYWVTYEDKSVPVLVVDSSDSPGLTVSPQAMAALTTGTDPIEVSYYEVQPGACGMPLYK